ncbi:Alpha/beta hydrolase family/alpha/beta hydrolase fold/Serine hydrolase [Novymonas esmeraldas]|uniref:Alpha/beta hydrolase family/alpha/beta hydrolase fold/Serine hydrolase n=1 Tax=Novymonas esmeraldas TaxID=1808958 RepID=A0AAW0EXV3_9TRYP
MSVVHSRHSRWCGGCRSPPVDPAQRQPPRRKHFYSWVATDREQLETTERLVLQGLPYHQARVAGLNTISTDDIRELDDDSGVARAGAAAAAAAVVAGASDPSAGVKDKDVLVLVHGFAGGVAGWAQNWACLAEHYRVYAFDLPGFARSERRATTATSVTEAMDFFCDYLDRWFARLDFARPVMVLAHSFGCFVSAHYAMRRGPTRIQLLLMAEPWGLMRSDPERIKRFPLFARMLLALFRNVSPLALLRGAGPAGPSLLRRTRPDFEEKWRAFLDDPSAMYDYLYHCNAQHPAVGERLFKACCHYDVCAKEPLVDTLPGTLDTGVRVGLLFGGKSWLNAPEGAELATLLRAAGNRVQLDTLASAGHQIFTDDVAGFNAKAVDMIAALTSAAPLHSLSPAEPLVQAPELEPQPQPEPTPVPVPLPDV